MENATLHITNAASECSKCGESGLFTLEQRQKHLDSSPSCRIYFGGNSGFSASSLNIISARKLSRTKLPKQRWLVPGLIPKKAVVFLGGKRGTFKTWVGLDCSIAIAGSKKFLGHFQTEKTDVLYIDSENGDIQVQKRLKMLLGDEKPPNNLYFCFFPKLRIEESTSELSVFLQEHRGAVIFVDSFRRVLNVDENDAQQINFVFVQRLRPLIEQFDATFILLHHTRKGMGRDIRDHLDEMRGSSELVNYADSVLIFERSRAGESAVFMRHAKSRTGIEHKPCRLEVESSEDSFKFIFGGAIEDLQNQLDKAASFIIKWASEGGKHEFKTSEVQDAFRKEFNPKTIGRALRWLCEQGKLTKQKKGVYTLIETTLSAFGTTENGSKDSPFVPSAPASGNEKEKIMDRTDKPDS